MTMFHSGLAVIERDGDTHDEQRHNIEFIGLAFDVSTSDDYSPNRRFRSYTLQCERNVPWVDQQIVNWHSPVPYVPLSVEKDLVDVVIQYGSRERGMFYKQSEKRKRELRRICEIKKVTLRVALSLRWHHMKQLNPNFSLPQLQLGDERTIHESSRLFEMAVLKMFRNAKIPFYSEDEQRTYINQHRPPNEPYPPTPDLILKRPIRIRRIIKEGQDGDSTKVIEESSVNWIEVKMFYGASTIKQDNRSAVGCLLQTAKKYVSVFGPGAMVFLWGCGDRLAAKLNNEQVMVLDVRGLETLDLDKFIEHMKTWCGDSSGELMP